MEKSGNAAMKIVKRLFMLTLCMLLLAACHSRKPLLRDGSKQMNTTGEQDTEAARSARESMKQGLELYNEGDMQGAIREWERSLALHEELGREIQISLDLSNLGLAHQKASDIPRAINLFEKALALNRKHEDRERLRTNLRRQGSARFDIGDYEEAGQRFQEAMTLDQELGSEKDRMIELTYLANVWWNLGRYSDSLSAYRELKAWARRNSDRKREADAQVGIGLIHEELGRYDEAIACYRKAAEIYRHQDTDIKGAAVALNNLGFAKTRMGRHAEALEDYRQALVIFQDHKDLREEAMVTSNMGQIHALFKKYPKALEQIYHALGICEGLGDKRGQALNLIRLGGIYEEMGNFMLAERNYREGMKIARDIGRSETSWRGHYRLGRLHEKQDNEEQALKEYEEAVAIIEGMVPLLESREDREGFLGSKIEVYDTLIQLLFKLHRRHPRAEYMTEALAYGEKLRGLKRRQRLDQLERPFQDLTRQAFFDRQRRMRAKIRRVEERLAEERARPDGRLNRELIEELEGLRGNLKADFKRFVDNLKEEDPSFLMWISVDPVKLSTIQKVLERGEAILEYYVTERYTCSAQLRCPRFTFGIG